MDLKEFAQICGLTGLSQPDRILHLGWFLHTQKNSETFDQGAIRACYREMPLAEPNFSEQFTRLIARSPKVVIKVKDGLKLEHSLRVEMDGKYGQQGYAVQITQLLKGLPARIPDLKERTYLDEALSCYKVGAFRAAIVMTWNLAYHHLCQYIIQKKLAEFNARWPISNPGHHKKAGINAVSKIEDFGEEFRESQVIKISHDANIITGDVFKVLDQKLGLRNSAAHPSDVIVGQLQADHFIDDLVKNVVLHFV